MVDLTEMWDALAEYQPYADRKGFGEEWRRMCIERTDDAAWVAAATVEWMAVAYFAEEAAGGAGRAIEAATEGMDDEDPAWWARHAIENIRKAIEQEESSEK